MVACIQEGCYDFLRTANSMAPVLVGKSACMHLVEMRCSEKYVGLVSQAGIKAEHAQP